MISVIIPAYNAENTILQTIQSVLDQNFTDKEIIVINDGSTDNTLQVLTKIEAEINAEKKTKITIITTQNRGVSHARNLGFNHSKGKYIQYLDADDLLTPDKLYVQYQALEASNGDVAYGNWHRFIQKNEEIKITKSITRKIEGDIEIALFTDFWCPPAVLLYSRKIAEKLKWNENLPVIQDARYFLDAALLGGKFIYCPHFMALYREGQNQSLSQQSESKFVKDVLYNCKDIYKIWEKDIQQNSNKEEAIIKTLRYCVNRLSIFDKKYFYEAIELILKIRPDYIPPENGSLRIFSKLFGYKRAERLASLKRNYFI